MSDRAFAVIMVSVYAVAATASLTLAVVCIMVGPWSLAIMCVPFFGFSVWQISNFLDEARTVPRARNGKG